MTEPDDAKIALQAARFKAGLNQKLKMKQTGTRSQPLQVKFDHFDETAISNYTGKLITYVDIDTGDHFTTASNKFFDPKKYRVISGATGTAAKGSGTISTGASATVQGDLKSKIPVHHIPHSAEIDYFSYTWRMALKYVLYIMGFDEVNKLRLSRALQLTMPFLTGYESHLLDLLISAMDDKDKDLDAALNLCFRCRNVSRTLVQTINSRFDFWFHNATWFKHNRFLDGIGNFGAIPLIGACRHVLSVSLLAPFC